MTEVKETAFKCTRQSWAKVVSNAGLAAKGDLRPVLLNFSPLAGCPAHVRLKGEKIPLACSTPRITRIAIGAFADASRLEAAFSGLMACSVEPVQLCLIGTGPRLKALEAEDKMPSAWRLPAEHYRDLGPLDDGEHLLAAAPAPETIDLEPMRTPRGLLSGLEAALSHGAVALMVSTRSVAEFAEATRVLLRFASYRVRTSEVVDPLG